ncbi:cation:proton antiporter [Thermosulfuriphilus sp.]
MVILQDVLYVLGFALGTSLACHYLRIPNLIGFIIAGTIIGPFGLKLIQNVHEVEILAELGVVLLLFTIGLEFSPAHLQRLKRVALLGGSSQISLTIFLTGGLYWLFISPDSSKAAFVGSFVALSSTAIVLTLLQQGGKLETPQGQVSLGILLFQDLAIVPLILLVPFLAGKVSADLESLGLILLKGAFLLGFIYLLGRWGVSFFIDMIVRTRSRELFVLAVITFCLAIAWGTYLAGLSLSLGAFLAGFVLARSEYSYQAVANILPFRDFLSCFFFISIGMLFNPQFLLENPILIFGLAFLFFLLKSGILLAVVKILGYPLRIAFIVALSLFQIGEFSFVLAQEASKVNLLPHQEYQLLIAVSILTMLATPFLISLAERWQYPLKDRKPPLTEGELRDHIVIVGFGIIGRALRDAAKRMGIDYTIIEMNPETVKREKKAGEPIIFGDATYEYILREAQIKEAKVMALTIPDYLAGRRVVALARKINPDLYIIARTRYVAEIEPLLRLGADEVIPEELVVALEIFVKSLQAYLLPRERIQGLIQEFQKEHYSLLCPPGRQRYERPEKAARD